MPVTGVSWFTANVTLVVSRFNSTTGVKFKVYNPNNKLVWDTEQEQGYWLVPGGQMSKNCVGGVGTWRVEYTIHNSTGNTPAGVLSVFIS